MEERHGARLTAPCLTLTLPLPLPSALALALALTLSLTLTPTLTLTLSLTLALALTRTRTQVTFLFTTCGKEDLCTWACDACWPEAGARYDHLLLNVSRTLTDITNPNQPRVGLELGGLG